MVLQRIDELTGLRCIAVSLVIAGHCGRFSPLIIARLGNLGETGVQIFFVLSGFLITTLLMRELERNENINILAFYRRRILRIVPAFYVFLAVLAVLVWCRRLDIGWQQFIISAGYLWNYAHLLRLDGSFRSHPDGNWYLGHSWSLALEEQFYLLWPAMYLFVWRRNLVWAVPTLTLAIPIIRLASYSLEPDVRRQLGMMFHTGADTILAGCCLAIYRDSLAAWLQRWVNSKSVLTGCVIVLLAIVPKLAAVLGGYWTITYGPLLTAGAINLLLLCCLAQPGHWVCVILRSRICLAIGTISYSLYLWQQLFNDSDSPVFIGFPCNILASAAAAGLSYWMIERPFLQLKDRRQA